MNSRSQLLAVADRPERFKIKIDASACETRLDAARSLHNRAIKQRDEVIVISSARSNAFRETFLARVPSRAHLDLLADSRGGSLHSPRVAVTSKTRCRCARMCARTLLR